MIGIDIQGKVNLDTNEAKQQVQTLTESLSNSNLHSMASSSNNAKPIADLGGNVTPSIASDVVDESKKTTETLNDILHLLERNNQLQPISQATENNKYQVLNYNNANSTISSTASAAQQLLDGKYLAIAQNSITNVGRGLQSKSHTLSEDDENGPKHGIAKLLGGLGTGGVIAGALVGLAGAAFNKATSTYEQNLPSMENFYRSFNPNYLSSKSGGLNSSLANESFQKTVQLSRGTGLSNSEFIDLTSEYAKYGWANSGSAANAARGAANMARLTGMDIDQIQRIQGLNYRYGNVGGENTINSLYQNAGKAGITLEDLQKFMPEFLTNIENAMEMGVSNGFSTSVDDVADTLSFIGGLSEDEAWKKNTGKTYTSIASGLAGAVNLSSTTDLITFQALNRLDDSAYDVLGDAKTGDSYLDKAMLLESNPTAGTIKAIHAQMQATYGDDMMAGVMSYKDLYGLNTKGAVTLYKALSEGDKSDKEIQGVIDSLTSDDQYKSDSTIMQDNLNRIDAALTGIGESLYDIKLWKVDKQADLLELIYSAIGKSSAKEYEKEIDSVLDMGFFTKGDKDDEQARKKIEAKLREDINSDDYDIAVRFLKNLQKYTPEEIMGMNLDDKLNLLSFKGDYAERLEGATIHAAVTGTQDKNTLLTIEEARDKAAELNDQTAISLFKEIPTLSTGDIASWGGKDHDIINLLESYRDSNNSGARNAIIESLTKILEEMNNGIKELAEQGKQPQVSYEMN